MQRRSIVMIVVAMFTLMVAFAALGTWLVGQVSSGITARSDQGQGPSESPAPDDRDREAAVPDHRDRDPSPAEHAGGDAPPPARPPEVPDDAEAAIVDRVVDGDTIRVVAVPGGSIPEGGSIRIRLLNIDTPELARFGDPAECGAEQVTARVEELVASGDLVWLVADREGRDRFDRPLRGVWLSDGTFLNELLAEEGYGEAVLFPPNDRFHARVDAAAARARAAGRGIWGELCPA